MESSRKRSSLVIAVVIALMALPMAAHSALVGSGSITTPTASGVTGGGNWTSGVTLGWSVTGEGDYYLYSYTFQAPSQASGLSHFILQTSDTFATENIKGISHYNYELDTFSSETEGNSNPGMPPGAMYGIKFDAIGGNEVPWMLSLLSDRAPMDGDFYAKGGESSFAYNSGFGALVGANILVPDTVTRVPEAGALLLFGSGLIGLVGYRRVRRMQ